LIHLTTTTIIYQDQAKIRKPMFLDSIYRYCKQESEGLSGASAAKHLGISATCFNSYCNWRNSGAFPSLETIEKIAAFIDWDFDDVYLAVTAAKFDKTTLSSKLESQISVAPKPPRGQAFLN
jgi:hypothetical protein